jgi:hypothetical protein
MATVLRNLRIACPNCNATLDTHCGKVRLTNACAGCGSPIAPHRKFCGYRCVGRTSKNLRPAARKVERPPLPQLLDEIERLGRPRLKFADLMGW